MKSRKIVGNLRSFPTSPEGIKSRLKSVVFATFKVAETSLFYSMEGRSLDIHRDRELACQWSRVRSRVRSEVRDGAHRDSLARLFLVGMNDEGFVYLGDGWEAKTLLSVYGERMLALWRTENAKVVQIYAWSGASGDALANVESKKKTPFRYSFENYVLGDHNRAAVRACCLIVSDDDGASLFSPLFIHGGVGVGKTHLLRATFSRLRQFDREGEVLFMSSEDFLRTFLAHLRKKTMATWAGLFEHVKFFVLDDLQFFEGKTITCGELTQIIKKFCDVGSRVLAASSKTLGELELPPSLLSLFRGGGVVEIGEASSETRMEIIRRKAREWRMPALEERYVEQLSLGVAGSIRSLEGALKTVYLQMQVHGVPPSPSELAPWILTARMEKPSFSRICTVCSHVLGVDPALLYAKNRQREVALARMLAMYLAKHRGGMRPAEIARALGRDHSTVLHGINRIAAQESTSKTIKAALRDALTLLREDKYAIHH